DLYVYLDNDQTREELASEKVTAAGTSILDNDQKGTDFSGTFVEATSSDGSNPSLGNYVVFRGLTETDLELRITADQTLGSKAAGISSIAGLQIVSGPDRENMGATGDVDQDRVLGDNGILRFFAHQLYDIVATDLQASDPGTPSYQSDTIRTGVGSDVAIGGNGPDTIATEGGEDLLIGDNARVILFDSQVIGIEPSKKFDPYTVLGVQLLGEMIGAGDSLSGGADDDVMFGQYGGDTYVFSGNGIGQDY
ncbi:unnamed protein product, partial [Discosporangium mesarthrocarpum]